MSQDDKINVAILIGLLIFAAVVVPARLQESRDAEMGRIVQQSFPK